MANTYAWKITQLEVYPKHQGKLNVVFAIHWRRTATDGAHISDVYGLQNIELTSGTRFTSFDKLTEEQVIGWLESIMDAEHVATLDNALDKKLADLRAPVVVTPGLPWVAM